MKHLSSLFLTLYALGGIVLCLGAGMILVQMSAFSTVVQAMDRGLILDWLFTAFQGKSASTLLGIWFLSLFTSVGVLVINLCACTWTRLIPRLRNRASAHSWLLLLAHVLMILILMGHLSQMTLGFKEEGIRLMPTQSKVLPRGLRLAIDDVHFENDPRLLNLTYRQARKVQTIDAFSLTKNLVQLSLWQEGTLVKQCDLRILEPLVLGGLRITLSDFFRDDGDQTTVGAILTVTCNPFLKFFFAAYIVWIAVYIMLAIQTFAPFLKTAWSMVK
ncbi:MAG: hypothetical protein V1793_08635 [Pseudomonadota bacterium]